MYGLLAAARLPVWLVTTPHGWSTTEGWRIAAYERIGRLFTRRFDRLYPLSRGLENDLLRRGYRREQVRLVRNGVNDRPLKRIYAERAQRRHMRSGVLTFVGRICKDKGVLDLIEAFATARLPRDAALWYVGEGPATEMLAQRIGQLGLEGRVRLCGFVKDVSEVLRVADALILPSYSEGIPRVLMEACAAGVPTIATDISGIRELIRHEYNGLLVPVADRANLAKAIERVYEAPDCMDRLVVNARKTIDEGFTSERQAREYEREYWSLARAAQHAGSTYGATLTDIKLGAGGLAPENSNTPISGADPT